MSSSRMHDEAGAIAVLFAISSMVLFLIAALVVDLGLARDVRRQSQNSSDASALAAANVLYLDGTGQPNLPAAVQAAEDYAAVNMGTTAHDWATCTDPGRPQGYYVLPGATPCVSFDEALAPSKVRVKLPDRVVHTTFGGVTGVQQIDIATMAQADVNNDNRAKCGVCVLGPGTHDLQNGDMSVTGANVRVNGNLNLGSNGHLTVSGGTVGVQGIASGANYSPTAAAGQPPIADPLASWTPPVLPPTPAVYRTNPCSGGPGIYGNVSITSSTACTLQPGIYYVTGTWSISGSGAVNATAGVTLYFTCHTSATPAVPRACATTGEAGGELDASGQGGIGIQPPTSGPTQGNSILYDRHDTSPLVFTGQGTLHPTTGTFYAPSADLKFNGNGNGATMDTLIITGNLELNGNPAALNTTYTPSKNAIIPPQDLALGQ